MYQYKQCFKYQLDKSSRKYICPRCGRKSFNLYLDGTGQPLSDEVGLCDRKDKCNWHYTPRQYLQDRKQLNTSTPRFKTPDHNPRPISIPPDFIPPQTFSSTLRRYDNNSLMIFLHSTFDRIIGRQAVDRVAVELAVGTSKQFGGSPIYWQVDENGRIRTGKIMGYNPYTGKRIKEPKPQLRWVHSFMKERYPDFRFQQCYFGSHRVVSAERKFKALSTDKVMKPIIGLFESEKAVLIVSMALVWGNMEHLLIPISCGGCEGFNPTDEKKRDLYDGIRVLKNREVVIFPDEGKYGEWKRKAKGLEGYSAKVSVSTVMERDLHPFKVECEYQEGDALDDVILHYFENGKDVAALLLTSF